MAAETAASKLKVVLFLGSVRKNRFADRVAMFVKTQLNGRYDLSLLGNVFFNFNFK